MTVDSLRKVRPTDRTVAVCDGGGLYLIVAPAASGGAMAWEYRYSSPMTGRRTSIRLGHYPALSLADARKARTVQAGQVQRGLDPALERKRAKVVEAPEVLTLERAVAAWDAHRVGMVQQGTRTMALDRLRLHVLPALGQRDVATLQASEVRRVLDTLVARGTRELAHRVCTIIHQVFEYLEARGEAQNPVRALRRAYPAAVPEHFAAITTPGPFGALLRAVDAYGGHVATRYALRLLPLVFLRSSELRHARWPEFDLDGATWRISSERMKVRRNGEHTVPLARQAVALLRELQAITGDCEFVFPSPRTGAKPLSDATLNAALTSIGYGTGIHVPHGFRTSASTMLNEMAAREAGARFNFEHIEMQLAHRSKDGVRDAYMRAAFLDQRRAMMQAWADECDRMKAHLAAP